MMDAAPRPKDFSIDISENPHIFVASPKTPTPPPGEDRPAASRPVGTGNLT